jgi:hypothetical protein
VLDLPECHQAEDDAVFGTLGYERHGCDGG